MSIETNVIYNMDCLVGLKMLPSDSVNCCVTSPPYYALRDYGVAGQIGREKTPEEYVNRLTEVFRELFRVLRPDGTFWLVIADSYCGKGDQGSYVDPKYPNGRTGQRVSLTRTLPGYKAKDMIGIPWMVAFALRNEGWYLRNDIIWHKANPMPESAKDRCSRCYEHIFLFAKSKRYYFDHLAIAEPIAAATADRLKRGRSENHKYIKGAPGQPQQKINLPRKMGAYTDADVSPVRNKRDVWHINTEAFHGQHFAVFPQKLVETCILAGCPENGIVLDPFMGSGTVGIIARRNNRRYVGIELNAEYCAIAEQRIAEGELEN